ncbi:MAG: 3'-5' exonuclease [Bacillota bacterium]|nr:3'-5' exonuclease [Bacillota bacterium]
MNQSEIIEFRKKIMQNEFGRMNNMQLEAVFSVNGPLLILAGAGSGKTTVLVNRIANLIRFGDAYNSMIAPKLTTDEENELQNAALHNGNISDDLRRKLAVDSAKPWQILAITFTNKAAGELKDRINARVEEGGDEIWASTFHSTCARILRRFGDRIGYTGKFTVYDTDDSRRLMKDCLKTLNVDEKFLPHKSVLAEISKQKDKMISPQEYMKNANFDSRLGLIGKAYQLYQERLKSSDAMDFDDLLCNTVKLFIENEDVLSLYQNQFKYIMVDEYQDTNKVQYKFIGLLAQKNNNICVVGDDDQSIYKFRGATIENILSFEHTFKNAKVIRLEQNYRSTQNILDAANNVIAKNKNRKGKTLWTQNGSGGKIEFHTALSERDEAGFIATKILDEVAAGRKFSDFAVLYRTNAQSRVLETTLTRCGVPHRVIGGIRFYDREEIKDMTAYLNVINNKHDDIRLKRIINKPKRGIGDTTVQYMSNIAAGMGTSIYEVMKHADEYEQLSRSAGKLKEFCRLIDELIEFAENGDTTLEQLYEELLEKTQYESFLLGEKETAETKIENIKELSSNIIMYEEENGTDSELSGFLEEISLLSDIDNYDKDADCTVMMTLHSAKGLEFPVVFIPGMEDGIFPGQQTMEMPDEIEEERRLAYVGITRAKEKLYLITAKERMLYGMTKFNRPSRFALDIPEELVEKTGAERVDASTIASQYSNNSFYNKQSIHIQKGENTGETFNVGDNVSHKTFGVGMVISAEKMGNDTLLEIAFEKVGTKKLMSNFARLQKL